MIHITGKMWWLEFCMNDVTYSQSYVMLSGNKGFTFVHSKLTHTLI